MRFGSVGCRDGERKGAAHKSRLFAAGTKSGSGGDGACEHVGEVRGKLVLSAAGTVHFCPERLAARIAKSLAYGDHCIAVAAVNVLDVGADLLDGGWTLGKINEMRWIVWAGPAERRCGGYAPGVPTQYRPEGGR